MAVLAVTFVRFQLGAAPTGEPISGRVGHRPIVEALLLGGIWRAIAVGALLFLVAVWFDRVRLLRWTAWAWLVSGVVILFFGALSFHTHIGMYYDTPEGMTLRG